MLKIQDVISEIIKYKKEAYPIKPDKWYEFFR